MASINAVYIHIFLGVCVQATAACPWCSQCRRGSVPSWACPQGWSPLLKQVVYNFQYTEGKLTHQHHRCLSCYFTGTTDKWETIALWQNSLHVWLMILFYFLALQLWHSYSFCSVHHIYNFESAHLMDRAPSVYCFLLL